MTQEEEVMSRRMKDRLNLAKAIEQDVHALAMKLNKLTDHDLETYKLLFKPDCLFNDCPISPFKTYNYLKLQMIKEDLDFVGFHPDGKHNIKKFSERAQEVMGWAIRFSNKVEAPKKGIDAIL